MNFESLGLNGPILRALRACNYHQPTPIQEKAIPPALTGRDVLGCAQTGTGKTCAFGTPLLQRLAEKKQPGKAVRALILTPTRELALQIDENLHEYARELPLQCAVIFGGVGQAPQVEQLRRGIDVLTATPGRLLDLSNQGLIRLDAVEIFVLDEADRMLDMGFIHDVKKVIALLPKKKQTLFFSATMPPEITELVDSLMQDPVRVAVTPVSSPVEVIRQEVYLLDRKNKTTLLTQILAREQVPSALVFTRTKHGADKVTRELVRGGVAAAAIHGNKSQTARQSALADFKSGKLQVLVATDIAARGIDIDELSHVFNYNLPEVPETYIHRIGRTGRAGRGGTAISFCDHSEEPLLRGIEALLGRAVPRIEGHDFPMEEFEAVRRDKKGRVINPDDEEARTAARERRMEKAQTAKPKKQSASPVFVAKKQVSPKKQAAAPQKADTILSSRNPLEGEVIMDATARLFASRKPRSGEQKQAKSPAASDAKPTDRNKSRKPKPTGGAAAAHIAEKQAKKPAAARAQQQGLHPKPAAGRGPRRRIPTVEGPRSRQKDSTEQPSLMKPFYLDHD